MKIACICNLNQSQYVIARYLRDMGHDVTLFLWNEYTHFLPEADTCGSITGIKVETLPLQDKDKILNSSSKRELSVLQGFDVYFGSEVAPAFLARLGIQLDYYILIGTDLTEYPFYKSKGFMMPSWQFEKKAFSELQRLGIKSSRYIFLTLNGDPYYETSLARLGFKGTRIPMSLPLVYLPEYASCRKPHEVLDKVRDLKRNGKKLIVSTNRIDFVNPDSEHYKGSDILLKGFASYAKKNPNTILILLTYGSDIAEAKELITELDIGSQILWLPKMNRKEIMQLLPHASIGIGNLGREAIIYNTVMEYISCGLPVIQRGTSESQLYPYFQCSAVDKLVNLLNESDVEYGRFSLASSEALKWLKKSYISMPLVMLGNTLDDQKDSSNFKWMVVFKIAFMRLHAICIKLLEPIKLFYTYRLRKSIP